MIQIFLIILLSIGTIYNLIKRTEIEYFAEVTIGHYLSIIFLIFILLYLNIYIFKYNFNNYLVSLTYIIYNFSAILSRGFNRKGIYNMSFLITRTKFYPWNIVKALKLNYLRKSGIDVDIVFDVRVFNHRYSDDYEKILLKIKKDLKI